MDNTIYIVLGVVFVIYLWISIYNRKIGRRRRKRKFMEDYRRKDGDQQE